MRHLPMLLGVFLVFACGDDTTPSTEAGPSDVSVLDARLSDGETQDAPLDAGQPDAGCLCGEGLRCNTFGECVVDCPSGCGATCPQGCFELAICDGPAPHLIANVHTAGIDWVPGPAADASIYYRRAGEDRWSRAHPASELPDGRLATSLFDLLPDTLYELQIQGGGSLCADFRTLKRVPDHETSGALHVQAGASAGGDGSVGSPLSSIQSAIDALTPSITDIRVGAGLYHEEIHITESFPEHQHLRLTGAPGATLSGLDVAMEHPAFVADGDRVWSVPFSGDPRYMMRDQKRLYHFESLAELRGGQGHGGSTIEEGFFADGSHLYLRSLRDPAESVFAVPDLGTAIALDGAAWVWIEGFEIVGYGEGEYAKGVDIRDSDHVVLRHCRIHDIPSPVWVRRASSFTRIEDNEIYQSATAAWPWRAMKATDHENSAIVIAGGEQSIVARNDIYAIFNGVYTGSFSEDQDPTIAFDADIYGNRLRNVQDDGLEPEGACVNVRYWDNVVDGVHNGVSLAPITYGPTWVLRNRFTDYDQSGFKLSNDSSGAVFLYHNTCYTDRADQNGMNVSGAFENMVFRNNVVRGTRYALEMSRSAGMNDLDYDNWFSTRGAPVIKWDNQRYDDVSAWCAATGLECHAQSRAPMLDNPGSFRFGPVAASPNVDAGERIFGINDHYLGAAPDIGYVESGAPETPALDVPTIAIR